MSKHVDRYRNLRGNRHPLPELLTLTVKKSPDDFTKFEHLMVGDVLEQFRRIRRQG